MRRYTERPVSTASKEILREIATEGLKTWLDLANLLFVYIDSYTFASLPQQLAPIKEILDANKPYWQQERVLARKTLKYPLPETVIATLNLIVKQYNTHRPRWLITRLSLRHAILMIMHAAINEDEHAVIDHDYSYDDSGFIVGAEGILESIKSEFERHRDSYDHLHQGYIEEAISACHYILRNIAYLSSQRSQVTLITDRGLDNVPYHSESHRTNESSHACLNFIVNGFISAFDHFQSQQKLSVFFKNLYGGNCIEGRLRGLFDDYSKILDEKHKKKFSEEINRMAPHVSWYLIATGKTPSMAAITQQLFDRLKDQAFKIDNNYLPNGRLTDISPIERYAADALLYLDGLAVCDPDEKNGDYSIGISRFQAIFRGTSTRKQYYFEIRDVISHHSDLEHTHVPPMAPETSQRNNRTSTLGAISTYFMSWFHPRQTPENHREAHQAEVRRERIEYDVTTAHQIRFFVHHPQAGDQSSDDDYVLLNNFN